VTEARTGKRFPLHLPIKIHKEDATIETAGMTGDLSAAGVYIRADAALEVGSPVEFEITLPPEVTGGKDDVVIQCRGRVVRTDEPGAAAAPGEHPGRGLRDRFLRLRSPLVVPEVLIAMLKLILADNQAIFRAGIAKVLAVEDEMRIVAQAQTPEQMFMALDKFRAAVLIVAGGFHTDFNATLQASIKAKTRVVILADTGESAQRYMAAGAHGVVYRNVTSPALVDCVRKVARGENWVQDTPCPASSPKTIWSDCASATA
jgi:hypothetical protein